MSNNDMKLPPFTLGTAISYLVGMIGLVGAFTLAVYALPFESKTSAEQTALQLNQTVILLNKTVDQVNALATNQAVLQETVKNISNQAAQIDDLRKTLEQVQLHVEGLEADQKADDSARLAHRARTR